MTKFIYTNILGAFIFNNQLKLVEAMESEDEAKAKYKNLKETEDKHTKQILHLLKDKKYFEDFRKKNTELTRYGIKHAIGPDNFIIQAISSIEETDKATNLLVKRLREWSGYYLPEFSRSIDNHETFAKLLVTKDKTEILKELSLTESIGSDISEKDLAPMILLAKSILQLYELKSMHENYLQEVMKIHCPNILAIAGPLIGAKLLEHSGSLKKLSLFPASTLQLLGAEKALFRHLINKKHRPPRHGLIINHPLVLKAKDKDRGKVSRALADKLSIASKVDYYKGKFIGDELRKKLENRFKKL